MMQKVGVVSSALVRPDDIRNNREQARYAMMATKPSSPTDACVAFAGEITEESVAATVAHLDGLAEQDVGRVVLMMHTLGGDINAGMRLYERLRAMPFALITHGVGVVASMGVPIYLAGEERLAGPQCEFLLNRPGKVGGVFY
jgi:ATP-dependent Clp protease protease subunit